MYKFQVFLPDISEQKGIVKELDSQIEVLNGLQKMKADAEIKINKILAEVWGIDFVESNEKEVEE